MGNVSINMESNNNIILECTISPEIWGMYTRHKIMKYIIYSQPIHELIGIYPHHTRTVIDDVHYIEIGYLFKMLVYNMIEAYDIIFCPPEWISYNVGINLELIGKHSLNVQLVQELIQESKKYLKKINEKLVDFKDNAYICASLATKAESILKSNSVKLTRINQLQAFYDERVHDTEILKEVKKIYKDVTKHLITTDLPMTANKEALNNELSIIRNAYTHK